jgi:hypothetical protein
MPAPLDALMSFLGGALRRERPVPEDAALAARCAEHVTGNDRLSPAEQVDIYRRQFWMRHVDSLIEDYPGLQAVLGEDAFEAFCRAYLAACPPRSFTLRDLGDRIVAFAERYEGFPEGRARLARDLVLYENAFVDLFDGADPPPLDPVKVREMPEDGWSTARIVLHPLARRMRLEYPVHDIRTAVKEGAAPAIPAPRQVHLLLHRKELIIRTHELDPLAYALLDALARGVPLVPACEALATGLDDAAAAGLGDKVRGWFAHWTSSGLIVDIEG